VYIIYDICESYIIIKHNIITYKYLYLNTVHIKTIGFFYGYTNYKKVKHSKKIKQRWDYNFVHVVLFFILMFWKPSNSRWLQQSNNIEVKW